MYLQRVMRSKAVIAMADVIYRDRRDVDSGSSGALGVIIGILLVLVLLFGAWWLFFRAAPVDQPDTTIIEQPENDVEAPDTNIVVPEDGGSEGGETTTSP